MQLLKVALFSILRGLALLVVVLFRTVLLVLRKGDEKADSLAQWADRPIDTTT